MGLYTAIFAVLFTLMKKKFSGILGFQKLKDVLESVKLINNRLYLCRGMPVRAR